MNRAFTALTGYTAADARPGGALKGAWHPGLRGTGETILVVDDEGHIGENTKTTLGERGYEVITAAEGIKAVTLYSRRREAIPLVLSGMAMPPLDGCAPVERAFVRKPCSAKQLLTAVREVISGA